MEKNPDSPPAARAVPADPKQLSKADQKRLIECTARLFGDDNGERERAALELVDFGAAGAKAVVRILGTAELQSHKKGMWALLHTLADLLSLDVPPDLEAELIQAAGEFLLVQDDNQEYVGWMAADTLANHTHETARMAVIDQVFEVFVTCLRSPRSLPQLAGIYGVTAMAREDSPAALLEVAGGLAHPDVEHYLEACLECLKNGEPPAVFEDPTAAPPAPAERKKPN